MKNETNEAAQACKSDAFFPPRTKAQILAFIGKICLAWILAFFILRVFVFLNQKVFPEHLQAADIIYKAVHSLFHNHIKDYFVCNAIFIFMSLPFYFLLNRPTALYAIYNISFYAPIGYLVIVGPH